jgi:preprotein translocase subunit SecA
MDEGSAKTVSLALERLIPDIDVSESMLVGKSREDATEQAKQAAASAFDRKVQSLNEKSGDFAAKTARYLAILAGDDLWVKHMAELREQQETAGFRAKALGTGNRGGAVQKPLDIFKEDASSAFRSFSPRLGFATVESFFHYDPASGELPSLLQ